MASRKLMIVAGAVAAVVSGAVGVGLSVYVLRDADSEETADNKDDPLQIAGADALEQKWSDVCQ